MTFILAEKPSVAASFAAALGVPKKGPCYQDDRYIVTNCIGHLLGLYDAQDYDSRYAKWDADSLPIIPEVFLHKPAEKTAAQLALIVKLLESPCSKYVVATDAGREGELIARLVLKHAGFTDHSRLFRFWTSSALTKDVILQTLDAMKPDSAYDGLYLSGLCRQLSDWLVGINFSRFFSVKFRDKFIFGRVQTPVLNMIVGREKDIKSFAKSFFYRLEVTTTAAGAVFVSFLAGTDGTDHGDKSFLEKLLPAVPGASVVTDVSRETKTLYPPRLLDLTELQKLANTKLGFTAKHTLELAQSLYEKHKCLSYPRTASRYLSRVNYDLFTKCLDILYIHHSPVDPDNKNIFNDEAMERNKEDHHALIILDRLPEGANDEERRIYSLVFSNMLNVILEPFVYERIVVTHNKDNLVFTAAGRKILQAGWKEHRPDEAGDDEDGKDKEEAQEIPDLKTGDSLVLKDPRITSHERKPPKSFTEAAVLAAMKKHGLGTPATRDSVIEGLVNNGYCFRKGKSFLPSEKAFFFLDSIRGLGHEGLSKYLDAGNTGEWESFLENEPEKFFDGVKQFVREAVAGLKEKNVPVFLNSVGACPVCGLPVVTGKHSYYCSARVKDNACQFSVGKTICDAPVTEADIKALLSGKKTGVKNMKSKNNNDFKARLKLGDKLKEFKVLFEFQDVKEAKKN